MNEAYMESLGDRGESESLGSRFEGPGKTASRRPAKADVFAPLEERFAAAQRPDRARGGREGAGQATTRTTERRSVAGVLATIGCHRIQSRLELGFVRSFS